jgi:predicted enzyme related to lactoylglutathione lyase
MLALEAKAWGRRALRWFAALAAVTIVSGVAFTFAHEGASYHPGRFVWFDLVTDDLDEAQRFYGAIFGWRFQTVGPSPGRYTLIENGGDRIGGMFVRPPPAGATRNARWLSMISVNDAAQAVRYVEQAGGSVLVPLARIAGRGTHALFRDPQGAVFGVLRSDTGDPPDDPVQDGEFFWADLLTTDPEKAAGFYAGLAGYELSEWQLAGTAKRIMLTSGGYARASVAPLPDAVKHPGWLPYVLVSDVRGTLEKAVAAGGTVLLEPRAELLGGNLAVLADTRGGVIGIVNWDTQDRDAGDKR